MAGRKSTILIGAALVGCVCAAAAADLLHDNGPAVPGGGGLSNVTEDVFGSRRTLLDDFVVPPGHTWVLQGFRWRHVWGTPMGGMEGTGLELQIVADFNGVPENPHDPGHVMSLAVANMTSYSEVETGEIFFSREVRESWATFDDIELREGTYWWEATIVGPENNFWLEAPQIVGVESWLNYEDFCGLMRVSDCIGIDREPTWELHGVSTCSSDLDDSGAVDFGDLLAILGAWGECDHQSGCEEDLDDNGVVGFEDLVLLLGAWGLCLG